MNTEDYSPGLEGIVAGESAISSIDVQRNRLLVRGYDLVDLSEHCRFEEVAYLLLHDDLPNAAALSEFENTIILRRGLSDPTLELLRRAPLRSHPMSLLRTAVSGLSLEDPNAGDRSIEAERRRAVELLAKIPTIIAAGYRLASGVEPVAPKPEYSQAANLLYMLRGSEPDDHEVAALDISLILYAEHGFNASTFTARVVASTLSDLYASIVAGIGALAGPLHGGANEKAMEMLEQIGSAEVAEKWVLDALAEKRKIMGFGHREYRTGDSRVPIMKQVGRKLATILEDSRWVDIADVVERTMDREKGIFANVDFPCSYVYYMLGIPIPLYTPIFVSSRVTGWAAHIMEQLANNRIIRPAHLYRGPAWRRFTPLSERG